LSNRKEKKKNNWETGHKEIKGEKGRETILNRWTRRTENRGEKVFWENGKGETQPFSQPRKKEWGKRTNMPMGEPGVENLFFSFCTRGFFWNSSWWSEGGYKCTKVCGWGEWGLELLEPNQKKTER